MLISLLPFIDALKCYIVENDGTEKSVCLAKEEPQKDPRDKSDYGADIFSPGSESLRTESKSNCPAGQERNDKGLCVVVKPHCTGGKIFEFGKCRPRK